MIIGGIILSSMIFVEWKAVDNEHYRESYEILTEIGQKEMKINKEFGKYSGEFTNLSWIRLHNVDEFPILNEELPAGKITYTGIARKYSTPSGVQLDMDEVNIKLKEAVEYHNQQIDNLRDYFQVLNNQKITHLVLDKYANVGWLNDELRLHLKDIFYHEDKYPFLIKEYDSKENGFNYHLKLFKIDYDLYYEWINEN
tara:strand:- start:250 stop:843 length:594 start_codon:yes stop_codon:yes gene_type:complete